jgi:(hydroxyamino)benzene mutase
MGTLIDLRLARHGAILLLLAMLTGFVIGNLHNRDVGNAAHLTGLIGGYGLIVLGLLWPRLSLGRVGSAAGAWITAASLYLNWLGLIFKGLGAGPKAPSSPLLGPTLMWDRAGAVALTLAVLLSLSSVVIVLIGLRKLSAPANTRGTASAADPCGGLLAHDSRGLAAHQ